MAKRFDTAQLFDELNRRSDPAAFNGQVKVCVQRIYKAWLNGEIGDRRAFDCLQMLNYEILTHDQLNQHQGENQ